MELKGFDSFDISLGDEMRGERASLGKSLEDAERDLRIKGRMLTAIEDCDLTGFPNPSVISGYVRSYARYLGMDPEDCFERFCAESGYRSPAAMMSQSGDGSGFGSLQQPAPTARVGAEIANSRFAAPPVQTRFRARISMGALTSTLALIALICGLSYGGYALLQDIQRVGFAPLPEAPAVVAESPEIAVPDINMQAMARPEASDYAGGGALARRAPVELPPIETLRRDGPISAINPETAGIFAELQKTARRIDSADDAIAAARASGPTDPDPLTEGQALQTADAAMTQKVVKGVVLRASEETWVRVRDRDRNVLYEGTLTAGDTFNLPPRSVEPTLRTGNAGGIFIYVDGVAYGPVGNRGQVRKQVSLIAEDVRSGMPEAEPAIIRDASLPESQRSADASLTRP